MAIEPKLTTPLWSEIVLSDDEFEGESQAARRALLRGYMTSTNSETPATQNVLSSTTPTSARPPRPFRDHRRRRQRNTHRGHKFGAERASNSPSNFPVSPPPPRSQHGKRFAGITMDQLIAWPRQCKSATLRKSNDSLEVDCSKKLVSAVSETSTNVPPTDESFFNYTSSCNEFDSTEDTTPSRKNDEIGTNQNGVDEEKTDDSELISQKRFNMSETKTISTADSSENGTDCNVARSFNDEKSSSSEKEKTSDSDSDQAVFAVDHQTGVDERIADAEAVASAERNGAATADPSGIETLVPRLSSPGDRGASCTEVEEGTDGRAEQSESSQGTGPSSCVSKEESKASSGESSESLDNDNLGDVVFSQSYDIWFTDAIAGPKKGIDQKVYEGGMHYMGTFTSVTQYFEAHNMLPWTALPPNSVVAVCRHGIRPIWEDPANAEGGRFVVKNFPKEETEALFAKTALGFFSVMLRDWKSYNLVSVHIRDGRRGSDIQIWRNSTTNRLSPHEVKKDIAAFTSPDVASCLTVSFVPNRDSLVRNDCKLASAATSHSHKNRSGAHPAIRSRPDTIDYSATSKSVSRMYSRGKSSFVLSPEQKEAIAKAAVRDAADFAATADLANKAPSIHEPSTPNPSTHKPSARERSTLERSAHEPSMHEPSTHEPSTHEGSSSSKYCAADPRNIRGSDESASVTGWASDSAEACGANTDAAGERVGGVTCDAEASWKFPQNGSKTPSEISEAEKTQSPYSIRSRSSSQVSKYTRHRAGENIESKYSSNYRRHPNHQRGDHHNIPTVRFANKRGVSPIPDMVHPAEIYAATPYIYYTPPNAYPPTPSTSVSCRGLALSATHLSGSEIDTESVAMGAPTYAYSTPTIESFVEMPYWQVGAAPPINCVVDPVRGGYGYAPPYWPWAPATFTSTPVHLIQSSETNN